MGKPRITAKDLDNGLRPKKGINRSEYADLGNYKGCKAGPVTVTKPDGSQVTQPAYSDSKVRAIQKNER